VFSNKNVGFRAVTVSGYTISGADAGNYNIIQPTGLAANITARALSVTGTPVASDKVYDGLTADTISGASLAGVISGDIVDLGGRFADKNVGVGKAVTLVMSGADAGNYSLTPVGGLTADITAKVLTITGTPVGVNKVYDGTLTDTISGAALSGIVGADKVSLGGLFADKNVGAGKAVTLVMTGAGAGNYSFTPVGGLTADITPRTLTVSAKGMNKVYDAGTNATVTLKTNAVGGDVITTAYTDAAFLDKNVGTGKTVNVNGISVGGADAGNYILSNTTATATASIGKLNLAVTGVTADNKVYDGTTAATLSGTAVISALGSDVVALGGTGVGVFSNKNVGFRAVTVSGYTISGADAGNYNIIQPTGLAANITARALTITADNITRLYGLSNPLLTYSVGGMGLASGDTLATVFTGALTTAAVVSSPAGSYAITQGTLATNSNYIITTFINGVLTVQ